MIRNSFKIKGNLIENSSLNNNHNRSLKNLEPSNKLKEIF